MDSERPNPAPLAGAVVVFDLDGTLVDSAPDLIATLNLLLRQDGLPELALGDARRLIGQGARRMLERGFEAAGAPLPAGRAEALFEQFLAHYGVHLADRSRLFPGAEAALVRLRRAGARLAVCTNKPTSLAKALLEALAVADLFEAIVGPDAAAARKPDPRHLSAAVLAAGGAPAGTVMVGDASPDAAVARAAGAGLVLVGFGYADVPLETLAADVVIDRFDELPDACARLLGACGAPA
jgi:phosphoglycolate phosphatase